MHEFRWLNGVHFTEFLRFILWLFFCDKGQKKKRVVVTKVLPCGCDKSVALWWGELLQG